MAYTATSVVKHEAGYVISAQNKSLLPISNSELLDRATWVCGESGGSNEMITDRVQNIGDASKTLDASVAEYYAAAINNIANTSKGGFYEAIKIRMSRKGPDGNIIYTSSGYFTGQPDCGNSNSRAFAKARASGAELLNSQTRFGLFKPLVNKKLGKPATLRQFFPPGFVLGLLIGGILACLHPVFLALYLIVLALYLIADLLFSLKSTRNPRIVPILMAVFPVIHVSYGWGYLVGIAKVLLNKSFSVKTNR